MSPFAVDDPSLQVLEKPGAFKQGVPLPKAAPPKMSAWGSEADCDRRFSKNSSASSISQSSYVVSRSTGSKRSSGSRTAIIHNSNIIKIREELQDLNENDESNFHNLCVMVRYVTNLMQKFSVPLVTGVIIALIWANADVNSYETFNKTPLWDGANIFDHKLNLNFLVNDIFMCFFFGLAIKEVAEALLPGGSLFPLRNAINPLLATVGGIVGPVLVYGILVFIFNAAGMFDDLMCQQKTNPHRRLGGGGGHASAGPVEHCQFSTILKGWGVPTATDISLAWMFALIIFGAGHPVINFLLLLAILDDAIGMVIIAIFYPDPLHPVEAVDRLWLLLVVPAVCIAYVMRRMNVRYWILYVVFCAPLVWVGLIKSSVHPALALVFIIPIMPAEHALDAAEDECDLGACSLACGDEGTPSAGLRAMKTIGALLSGGNDAEAPMHMFEHNMKMPVDFGMFFFGLSNAGVKLNSIGGVTYSVLFALFIGKTLGISMFSLAAIKMGFGLPNGVTVGDLISMSALASVGLTVALFVANQALLMLNSKTRLKWVPYCLLVEVYLLGQFAWWLSQNKRMMFVMAKSRSILGKAPCQVQKPCGLGHQQVQCLCVVFGVGSVWQFTF